MEEYLNYYNCRIRPERSSLDKISVFTQMPQREIMQRALEGFQINDFSVDEIVLLQGFIESRIPLIESNMRCARNKEKDFLYTYQYMDNKCYSTLMASMKWYRSTFLTLETVLKKFCSKRHPSSTECAKWGISSHSTIDVSFITAAPYQEDLFPDSYPAEIHGFVNSLKKLMDKMNNCVKEIEDILQKEEAIKQNPGTCRIIYNKFFEAAKPVYAFLSKSDDIPKQMNENEIFRKFMQSKSKDDFYCSEYHNENVQEMQIACYLIDKHLNCDFSDDELTMFARIPSHIKHGREMIDSFEGFLPKGVMTKDKTKYIVVFLQNIGVECNFKTKCNVFMSRYDGKKIKYKTLDGLRNNIIKGDESINKQTLKSLHKFGEEINRIYTDLCSQATELTKIGGEIPN